MSNSPPSDAGLPELATRQPLHRSIPGSTILFLFGLEAFTGLLLMTVYSPSTTTAWSSVWYVQTQMTYGWLIRGMHKFSSDAMVLVVLLYLVQHLRARTYRLEGGRAWRTGLCLLGLAMALALTGYLLPWDQKGYWGTKVRTNILGLAPVIGPSLRALLLGGSEPGNLTLTRFYTLHVIVLPGIFLLLVRARRLRAGDEAVSDPSDSGQPSRAHRPVRDRLGPSLAWAFTLIAVLTATLAAHDWLGNELLHAPADPTSSNYPARPEWFNLFLFQWLKSFSGPTMEIIGAIVVPGAVVTVFFLFPYFDRLLPSRIVHRVALGLAATTFMVIAWLTYAAVRDDRNPADALVDAARQKERQGLTLDDAEQAILRARELYRHRAGARNLAERAIELAAAKGIPPEGPRSLLLQDPITRGPELFASHCASCHRFNGHNALGEIPAEPAASSDLAGFAGRSWIRGLLTDPTADRYFGRMKKPDGSPAHTRMSKWIAETLAEYADAKHRRELLIDFDAVAAYLEDESLHPGRLKEASTTGTDDPDRAAAAPPMTDDDLLILRGRSFFERVCNECHRYDGEHSGTFKAPEMLGYGSVEWIELMIAEPDHELRYRSKGRERAQMPRFKDRLSEHDRRMIAEWLHAVRRTGPGSAG